MPPSCRISTAVAAARADKARDVKRSPESNEGRMRSLSAVDGREHRNKSVPLSTLRRASPIPLAAASRLDRAPSMLRPPLGRIGYGQGRISRPTTGGASSPPKPVPRHATSKPAQSLTGSRLPESVSPATQAQTLLQRRQAMVFVNPRPASNEAHVAGSGTATAPKAMLTVG